MIKKMGGMELGAQPLAAASGDGNGKTISLVGDGGRAVRGPVGPSSGNPELDSKFREVSQMYEKQFLREMMKSMRSTVNESGLVKVNQGEKIFREQLDHEYVEKWGDKGGIGLSDMIFEQLLFHYGPKIPIQKPQGPIELNEKSGFTVDKGISPSSTEVNQTISYTRKPSEFGNSAAAQGSTSQSQVNSQSQMQAGSLEKVVAPWSGLLKQKLDLGLNQTFLEMWHDNGMKSRFVLNGTAEQLKVGQNLQEGEGLGYLSPETKNFFWNVSM